MPIDEFFNEIKEKIFIDFEQKSLFVNDAVYFFVDKQIRIIEKSFSEKEKPPFLLLSDRDFDILSNYLVGPGDISSKMTSIMNNYNIKHNEFSSVLKSFYLTVRNYIYKMVQQKLTGVYDENNPYSFDGQHDISVLGLSIQIYSLLKENYIDTVEEIIEIGAEKLKHFNKFGDNVLKEITDKMNAAGFAFGGSVR